MARKGVSKTNIAVGIDITLSLIYVSSRGSTISSTSYTVSYTNGSG